MVSAVERPRRERVTGGGAVAGTALVLFVLGTLGGCAQGGPAIGSSSPGATSPGSATTATTLPSATPAVSPSATATADTEPPDDPALRHRDEAGRLPGETLRLLVAARNRHDWRTVYLLTADPAGSLADAAKEGAQANDQVRGFMVLETRVIGSGKGRGDALVRVAFTAWTTPPGGKRYAVHVRPPGQWWTLTKVDGLWKLVVDV